MSNLPAILDAYEEAKRSGEPLALATVVNASGSTYRCPGARMFVTDSRAVGMISGGCLENDVVEHAKQVMKSGEARVVTYDTKANEDIIWGLGLGCNGMVQILIEPLDPACAFNPLTLLSQYFDQQQHAVLATIFNVEGAVKIGTHLIYYFDGTLAHNIADSNFFSATSRCAISSDYSTVHRQVLSVAIALCQRFTGVDSSANTPDTVWCRPGCGSSTQFVKALGWQVTVVDCRLSEATRARFPMADQVILTRRDNVHQHVQVNANTVAVVMTHNYLDDAERLKMLLPSPARYIGMLGPKHRTERLLQTLQQEGSINLDRAWERLHAPVGLDIGADTPAAIARSIVAEIQAVLARRAGEWLKHRQGAIHAQNEALPSEEALCLPSVL